MKCEDMDWVGYEANALDPGTIKIMEDHLAECSRCQKESSEQKKTTEILKQVWSEIELECIESQKLIDLQFNNIDVEEENKLRLHIDICSLCAESYRTLTEFYDEFDDKKNLPERLIPLPKTLQDTLQLKKKEDFTDRISKTLSALAEKGSKGVKDIKDQAAKIVERLTSTSPEGAPMPAIRKDAAEVDEKESEENDNNKPEIKE